MSDLKLPLIVLTAPFALLLLLSELTADYGLYCKVRDFGQPAVAVVQDVKDASLLEQPAGMRIVSYLLDPPGPALVRGWVQMSEAAASRYWPGERIGIVYASDDPAQNALSVAHAWSDLVHSLIVTFAYVSVLALALAMLRVSPPPSWRDETLRRGDM